MNDTLTTARALGRILDGSPCRTCPGRDFCRLQPESWCYDAEAMREDEMKLADYVDWRTTQFAALRGVL